MGASNFDGPLFSYGSMGYLLATLTGSPVPDYNTDAGPSMFYQGTGIPDVRYPFLKDRVQGYKGVVPALLAMDCVQLVNQIPSTYGAAKIAAAQNATSGTALTLVTAAATGIAINIPIVPFSGLLNGSTAVVAPIVLDFGFGWCNCTAASQTITVPDSTQYDIGMPLVIAGVGNSGGTVPLLTFVTAMPTATTITVNDAPLATNASTPVGTGNITMPSGTVNSAEPTGHLPYLAKGPGLFLDPLQSIARGVSITGVAGGAGGAFAVRGWDIYWNPMTETVTATSGATTVYGKKAFKAIASVTPAFTDAHNYSVGTSDVFGIHARSDFWENVDVAWAAATMTASTGWTTADTTSPATGTTGDVRGTIQTSAIGSGSGIGSNDSNGTVSSNVMTGRRLAIAQSLPLYTTIRATPFNTVPMFGQAQYAG